jgi:ATP-dependent Lon protease
MPRENEPDLAELPADTRETLEFVLADSIEDVFAAAFDAKDARGPRRTPAAERQAAAARV